MALKKTNITLELWEDLVRRLEATYEDNKASMPDENTLKLPADGKLQSVPLNNREWMQSIGYEHDERCLWFRVNFRRDLHGMPVPLPIGPKHVTALAKAILWNAAVYLSLPIPEKSLAEDAMRNTALSALRFSSCPEDLQRVVARLVARIDLQHLSVVYHGECLSRCGLDYIKEKVRSLLKRRTSINRGMRREVILRLLASGIMDKATRAEQDVMIARTLSLYDGLRASARRYVITALTTKGEWLKATGGVTLHPWTREELNAVKSESNCKAVKGHVDARVEDIKNKMAAGQPLNHADRNFKSRHKGLFSGGNA